MLRLSSFLLRGCGLGLRKVCPIRGLPHSRPINLLVMLTSLSRTHHHRVSKTTSSARPSLCSCHHQQQQCAWLCLWGGGQASKQQQITADSSRSSSAYDKAVNAHVCPFVRGAPGHSAANGRPGLCVEANKPLQHKSNTSTRGK